MNGVAAPSPLLTTEMARVSHTRPDALVIIVAVAFLIFYIALRRGWRPRLRLRLSARDFRGVRIRPVALLPSVLLLVLLVLLLSHG